MTNTIILISYNFNLTNVDSSLFIKHNFNDITIVLVYVDDLIITEDNAIMQYVAIPT
jgi:hypothetical protein